MEESGWNLALIMKSEANMISRIPVTIIAGFLGSGKTTLVNHIIASNRGMKIGVIVNDFGEIDIDSNLIVSASDEILEIRNGCICCSTNGDLRVAVSKLFNNNTLPEYLIIESTGIGDPLPIVKTFMRPEFIRQARVDSIVTVVDVENIQDSLSDISVIKNQIKFADFILLNKCDRVPEQAVNTVEALIREFNNDSRILMTVKCSVPLEVILGARVNTENMIALQNNHHSDNCDHECHAHNESNHGFISVAFSSNELLDPDKFQDFLQNIPSSIFRAKGFLRTTQSDQGYIFHLIAKRFTLDADQETRNPQNQLVFIGRDFDKDSLISNLKMCIY